MRRIVNKYDPVAMAEALAAANLPDVNEDQVRREFAAFLDAYKALANFLSYSDDMDALRSFKAMETEFIHALYHEDGPVTLRLDDLERWHRNNTLSWVATS